MPHETETIPKLLTTGSIAAELEATVDRVHHILTRHPDIRPRALAGRTRLFDRRAVARIRHELTLIDDRRAVSAGGPTQ